MPQIGAPLGARLRRMYREKGIAGFWYGVLGHAGYRRLLLLERGLGEPLPELTTADATLVRPLRAEDHAAFAALGQESAVEFRKRLEHGHQCWGAWCSGVLRHVQWLALGEVWIEHLDCRLRLDERVVYVYRAFTDPEFRGRGLAPAVHARGLAAMRERGFTLALCGVAPGNRPALSPWLKVGYRRIGFASTLRRRRGRLLQVSADRSAGASPRWKIESV